MSQIFFLKAELQFIVTVVLDSDSTFFCTRKGSVLHATNLGTRHDAWALDPPDGTATMAARPASVRQFGSSTLSITWITPLLW